MVDEKTRLVLTIEEKLSIINYKESHLEKSFATIANIFTEQWNKKIGKQTAFRSYHLIKTQRENGVEIEAPEKMLLRLPSKKSSFLRKNCTIPLIIASHSLQWHLKWLNFWRWGCKTPMNSNRMRVSRRWNLRRPGQSGVTVAIPSQSEVPNVKKRKQPAITDFFVKKHINKK